MTDNRSLDEFAGSANSAEPEPMAEEAATEEEPDSESIEQADAARREAVESTYDWTPGGAPCAMCGASVKERWRDAEGLVCIECKVW